MTTDHPDALQNRVRGIIEETIGKLIAVGMKPDNAAALLVIQGAIRIKDPDKLREAQEFVADLNADDLDDSADSFH